MLSVASLVATEQLLLPELTVQGVYSHDAVSIDVQVSAVVVWWEHMQFCCKGF